MVQVLGGTKRGLPIFSKILKGNPILTYCVYRQSQYQNIIANPNLSAQPIILSGNFCVKSSSVLRYEK